MKIKYSTMTEHLGSSAVREILKITQGKDIISLAGGLPAEDFFPVEAVREAYSRALVEARHRHCNTVSPKAIFRCVSRLRPG